MPMLAQNIGKIRERPSVWNAPNPTDIAPPAATNPTTGRPRDSPIKSAIAIASVQGSPARAREPARLKEKASRKASLSIAYESQVIPFMIWRRASGNG